MISVIIVLYNSEDYINDLIESLNDNISYIKNSFKYEFIFVNNEQNKRYRNIKLISDNVKIINSNKNIGFSKALNKGIETSKGDYILILNPDIKLNKNLIVNMYKKFNNKTNLGIVGSKIYNMNSSFQESCRRMFPTPLLLLKRLLYNMLLIKYNNYNYSYIHEDETCEVDSVSGACMMFPRYIYEAVDGFDERFFLYFEDTDFCYRTKKLGYKVVYNPDTFIYHHKHGSANNNNLFINRIYFYTSMLKFLFKYRSHYILFNYVLYVVMVIFVVLMLF